MAELRRLDAADPGFALALDELTSIEQSLDADVEAAAARILADVRKRGDVALLEYTARFDGVHPASPAGLEIPREQLSAALQSLDAERRTALEQAATRVRSYHERQKASSWD